MIHVIIGPPCSGKSTYIREHKKEGDVVIDYDVLAQALGYNKEHGAVGIFREVAMAARSAAVAKAMEFSRYTPDSDVWIIHSAPSRHQLMLYRDYGSDIVLLNPGFQTVYDRSIKDHRPKGTLEWIHNWYKWYASNGTDFYNDSKTFSERQQGIVSHMTDRMQNLIRYQDTEGKNQRLGTGSRKW